MIFIIFLLLHSTTTNEKTIPDISREHDDYSSFRDEDGYVDVFDVEYVHEILSQIDSKFLMLQRAQGIEE